MINKIPHFLQDHKKIIRSVWYSSYACCDLLKIEIYPQANHAPISFRIYSETGGGMCSGLPCRKPTLNQWQNIVL